MSHCFRPHLPPTQLDIQLAATVTQHPHLGGGALLLELLQTAPQAAEVHLKLPVGFPQLLHLCQRSSLPAPQLLQLPLGQAMADIAVAGQGVQLQPQAGLPCTDLHPIATPCWAAPPWRRASLTRTTRDA